MISVGLRWSNIGDNDLGISFQTVLLVLMFDVIVFTCLAVYFDAVSTTGASFCFISAFSYL